MTCGDDTEPKDPIISTVALRVLARIHNNRLYHFANKVLSGIAYASGMHYAHMCEWATQEG